MSENRRECLFCVWNGDTAVSRKGHILDNRSRLFVVERRGFFLACRSWLRLVLHDAGRARSTRVDCSQVGTSTLLCFALRGVPCQKSLRCSAWCSDTHIAKSQELGDHDHALSGVMFTHLVKKLGLRVSQFVTSSDIKSDIATRETK